MTCWLGPVSWLLLCVGCAIVGSMAPWLLPGMLIIGLGLCGVAIGCRW